MQGMLNEPSYGAMELKRVYQGNLAAGLTVGVLLHISAIVGLASLLRPEVSVDVRVIRFPSPEPVPRPWVDPVPVPGRIPTEARPTIGIPEPVPDNHASLEYTYPEPSLTTIGSGDVDGEHGSGIGGGDDLAGFGGAMDSGSGYPGPDVFVAVEFQPVPIKRETPVYPEMARLSGREGHLTIRALIDVDGSVVEAFVVKSSAPGIGFEEAAIAAALGSFYKPAIQNGRPLAIWVSYTVEFKLK